MKVKRKVVEEVGINLALSIDYVWDEALGL